MPDQGMARGEHGAARRGGPLDRSRRPRGGWTAGGRGAAAARVGDREPARDPSLHERQRGCGRPAGRRALALERGGAASPWRPVGCPVLGLSLHWHGEHEDASQTLTEAVRIARADGNHLAAMHASGGLAAIEYERGDAASAGARAAEAIALAEEHDLSEYWASSLSLAVRGRLLERADDPEAADEVLLRATELARRGAASSRSRTPCSRWPRSAGGSAATTRRGGSTRKPERQWPGARIPASWASDSRGLSAGPGSAACASRPKRRPGRGSQRRRAVGPAAPSRRALTARDRG